MRLASTSGKESVKNATRAIKRSETQLDSALRILESAKDSVNSGRSKRAVKSVQKATKLLYGNALGSLGEAANWLAINSLATKENGVRNGNGHRGPGRPAKAEASAVRRGPGRPKKRGPGRPRKIVEAKTRQPRRGPGRPPAKRGPGRPPKHRGPGRPPGKRGPGRPRKNG